MFRTEASYYRATLLHSDAPMNSGPSKSSDASDESIGLPESALRTVVSLVLFIHLFLVFLCLTSNLSISMVQSRLLGVFGPYTQFLNLDLNFTPYHLTHATINDVDHRIEVLPKGADENDDEQWTVLPDVGLQGSDRRQRYQRLAHVLSVLAEQDAASGAIAKDVGEYFYHHRSVEPVQLRGRRHLLQPWQAINSATADERDANSSRYYQDSYRANLIVNKNGSVDVAKRGASGEVAQPDANQ